MKTPIHKNPLFWIVAIVVFVGLDFVIISAVLSWSKGGMTPGAGQILVAGARGGRGNVIAVGADGQIVTAPAGVRIGNAANSPARAAFDAQIKSRQSTKTTLNETRIDLKPYANATLADPLDLTEGSGNNLAELPKGVHTYGGVPFDVEGVIRLAGNGGAVDPKTAPVSVKDIRVGHKFKKLHLFHGALNVNADHSTVLAKLVLHYADASEQALEIVAGSQVLVFVGPYQPPALVGIDKNTELGWVGSNDFIKQKRPAAGAHVYRTTFENPKPDVEVATVDYVSDLAGSAPFLVGLTIE